MTILNVRMLYDCYECYPLNGRDLEGKTVVCVGCDYGNSPVYFRLHGAKKVIGYERDKQRVKILKANLSRESWFEFRGTWNAEYPDADVFQMDIDGGEAILDAKQLKKYELWFVALHTLNREEQRRWGTPNDTMHLAPALEVLGGTKVHYNGLDETIYRGWSIPRKEPERDPC